jgi:hypothetical protein
MTKGATPLHLSYRKGVGAAGMGVSRFVRGTLVNAHLPALADNGCLLQPGATPLHSPFYLLLSERNREDRYTTQTASRLGAQISEIGILRW